MTDSSISAIKLNLNSLSKNELGCVTAFFGLTEFSQTMRVNKRLKDVVENTPMFKEYKKILEQCKQQNMKNLENLIDDNCKFIKEREQEMKEANFSDEQISQLLVNLFIFFSKGNNKLILKKTSDDKTLEYMKMVLGSKNCPFISLSFIS